MRRERRWPAVASTPPASGALVAGKYRVEREIGRGGMAVVLAATHIHLHEPVALKFLHPHVLARPDARRRFLREARVAMRLRGPHLARVHDFGTLDDAPPFIVSELLEGHDLSDVLERRGRLPVREAVDYVLQACEAMAEAHRLGIVHRDLKPANLFLTTGIDGSPCLKVLDFGVSSAPFDDGDRPLLLDDTAPDSAPSLPPGSRAPRSDTRVKPRPIAITSSDAVLGSVPYAAPEQLRTARDVDARADVWALGVVLHELVTGFTPFDGETREQMMAAILDDRPAPLGALDPRRLGPIMARCLAKERAARFSSVHALADALAPFASEGGLRSVANVGRIAAERPLPPSMRELPSEVVGEHWLKNVFHSARALAAPLRDFVRSAPLPRTKARAGRTTYRE